MRAEMKEPRNGHSACGVNEKFIAVTGGRFLVKSSCEMYDIV